MASLSLPPTPTRGQQKALEFREALYAYQSAICEDSEAARLTLDLIVGGGNTLEASKSRHRQEFTNAFRGHTLSLGQLAYFADRTFDLFCMVVRNRALQEYGLVGDDAQQIARNMLDHTEIKTQPTAKEQQEDLITSLEVDSSSCDDARRLLYGRDGSPERALEELKEQSLKELGVTSVAPEIVPPKGDA